MTKPAYSLIFKESGINGENRKVFENNVVVWEGSACEFLPAMQKYRDEHRVLVSFMEKSTSGDANVDLILEALIPYRLDPITLVDVFNSLVTLLKLAPVSVTIDHKRGFIGAFMVIFKEKLKSKSCD